MSGTTSNASVESTAGAELFARSLTYSAAISINVSLTLDPRFEFVTIASRSSFNNFKEIVDPSDSLVGPE